MSATELRTNLHQLIDQLDVRFLKAIHAMISVYQANEEEGVLGYEADGTPLAVADFINQAEQAVAAAQSGKGISVQELEKRSEEWMARMK